MIFKTKLINLKKLFTRDDVVINNRSDETENDRLEREKNTLEEVTHNYFKKWHRLALRWTLRKMIAKADQLRTNSDYGHSKCGCYVDDVISTLCFWHGAEAYTK